MPKLGLASMEAGRLAKDLLIRGSSLVLLQTDRQLSVATLFIYRCLAEVSEIKHPAHR